MPAFTTRYGLYKPGGGSTGIIMPDEIADIDKLNGNFDVIDAALGSASGTSGSRPSSPKDGQIFRENDTGNTVVWNSAGSYWAPVGTPYCGSQSVRDSFFPNPKQGNIAYRADLGRLEQYYELYNATTNPKGWIAAGWHFPLAEFTPIDGFTVSGAGATLKDDGIVKCNAVTGQIKLDNLFWDLFDEYVIEKNGTFPSGAFFNFQFIKADGTIETSSNYRNAWTQISGGSVTGNADSTSSLGVWDATDTNTAFSSLHILNPSRVGSPTTSWDGDSTLAGLQRQFSNGFWSGTKVSYRGIALMPNTSSFTGYFRVSGKRGNGA